MGKTDLERMAFCCILAVIGAVAITKPELTGDPGLSEGIIRWLLFALACGLVINDQNGRPFKVMAVSAIAISTILVIVITFKSYLGNVIRLSGAEISVVQNPDVFLVMMFALFIASALGIIITSYSRGITVSLLNNLINIELEQAKKVEAILNKVVSIGAVVAIIVFSVL